MTEEEFACEISKLLLDRNSETYIQIFRNIITIHISGDSPESFQMEVKKIT